jgi:leader peptidase (prepilin peptidase)/N-methyltransferase
VTGAGLWPWLAGAGGLVVGSFLNTAALALAGGPSPWRRRSACPACGRLLAWWELVPVAGWLLLAGRCRTCRGRVSLLYPLGELFAGLAAGLAVARLGLTAEAAAAVAFCLALLVCALVDLKVLLVPDLVVLPALGLALAASPWLEGPGPAGALAGAAILAGSLGLLAWGYWRLRGVAGLGMGDVKLAALLGAFLGPAAGAVAVGLGAMAALAALLLLMALGRAGSKTPVPLAPFLALGGAALALFRQPILGLILGEAA